MLTEGAVLLPIHPARSLGLPGLLATSPDAYDMAKTLTRLHYAAFVCVHGTPSQYVETQLVDLALGTSFARYTAGIQAKAPKQASAWVDHFAVGLTCWGEAGFLEPLVRSRAEYPNAGWTWTVGDYDDVVRDAAGRLGRTGRFKELRNLSAYLGDRLPERLDPDSRNYTYRRPLRR